MFLQILLFPIQLLTLYILPFTGCLFSQKHTYKWLVHFMITVFILIVIDPILSLLVTEWIVMFINIVIGGGMLVMVDNQKAKQVFTIADTAVDIGKAQLEDAKEKVKTIMKQYGLLQ